MHVDTLLRCWIRDTHVRVKIGALRLAPLRVAGLTPVLRVGHASPAGWHRFEDVWLERPGGEPVGPVEPVWLAALLGAEAAYRGGSVVGWDSAAATARLVERVAVSVRRLAALLAASPASTDPSAGLAGGGWAGGGLLSTLLDPAPLADLPAAQPVQLHGWWVRPGVLRAEYAGADPLVDPAGLLGAGPADPGPGPGVLLPVHPGRVAGLLRHPGLAALVRDGAIQPLGPVGPCWCADADGRTFTRAGHPVAVTLDEPPPARLLPDPAAFAELAGRQPTLRLSTAHTRLTLGPPGAAAPWATATFRAPPAGRHCLGDQLAAGPVTPEWAAAWVDQTVVPLLRLHAATGVALAPDPAEVRLSPGGASCDEVSCDDRARLDTTDPVGTADRFCHLLLHRQVLPVAGAAGPAAEERALAAMADRLRAALPGLAAAGPGGDSVARRWLSEELLPVRTAIVTGLCGRPEVFGAGRFQLARNPLYAGPEFDVPAPPLPLLTGDGWSARAVELADATDLLLVHGWMNTPHVARGWGQDWPVQRWRDHLAAQLAGRRTLPCILSQHGERIGYLEVYRCRLDPVADCYCGDPYDLGVHLAIGDQDRTGKGTVTALFPLLLRGVLAADPRCRRVICEPSLHNVAMLRAIEKSGCWRLERQIALPHKNAVLAVHRRGDPLPTATP